MNSDFGNVIFDINKNTLNPTQEMTTLETALFDLGNFLNVYASFDAMVKADEKTSVEFLVTTLIACEKIGFSISDKFTMKQFKDSSKEIGVAVWNFLKSILNELFVRIVALFKSSVPLNKKAQALIYQHQDFISSISEDIERTVDKKTETFFKDTLKLTNILLISKSDMDIFFKDGLKNLESLVDDSKDLKTFISSNLDVSKYHLQGIFDYTATGIKIKVPKKQQSKTPTGLGFEKLIEMKDMISKTINSQKELEKVAINYKAKSSKLLSKANEEINKQNVSDDQKKKETDRFAIKLKESISIVNAFLIYSSYISKCLYYLAEQHHDKIAIWKNANPGLIKNAAKGRSQVKHSINPFS